LVDGTNVEACAPFDDLPHDVQMLKDRIMAEQAMREMMKENMGA
jgi:hypothetical protein